MSGIILASCAAVFSVAPPLSSHKRLWGESGGATLKTAAQEASRSMEKLKSKGCHHMSAVTPMERKLWRNLSRKLSRDKFFGEIG